MSSQGAKTLAGMPDLKPVFARAKGADEQRCQQAEADLMDIMLTVQKKVKMGACLGCLFCPCTLGCSCCCCPLCFASGMVRPLTDWSEKYPLIAVEVIKNGPIKKEDGSSTVELRLPVPSLEAINRRRG
eukprot:CAMPEP_0197873074 /NCGR_PEP_ID=MMETSP1439-20131203/3001_1 /TAXON_ID=66791 /ORGANISM="Gonyaulax spinifera, Strain CCMP409" /LENGTH=128 /DNA_ID=CAMNT_0043492107 /DNA_START=1 /DNA_END=383 /DNA_ORIENTATION=-